MISNTTISLPPVNTEKETVKDYSPLLLLPLAAVALHQYTKKQLRKARHKMLWQFMKLQLRSLFSPKGRKKMSPLLKGLLILVLSTAVFWVILGPAAGGIALVVTLLFLAIYGSEL